MSVTSLNAQTRRVETIWYPTEEEALSTPFEKSQNYLDLNGIWDFAYFDSPDLLPEALRNCPEIDGIMSAQELAEAEAQVKWGDIKVPGNWEHQGHGVAIYVNQPYEFAPKNPQPPLIPDQTPVGIYRRTFEVPENWDGREIYLNLCGAKSGVYGYVNGQVVGYCEDSKDLARFDITSFLRKGDNELLLKIYRWSTGSYLECQDFWRISGIERDVYLSSESTDRDFNFSVSATLDDKLTTGILSIKTEGHGDFSYKLLDKDGSVVATSASGKTVRIPSPRLWTAETPELYTLLLKVDGEYTRFNVGFRQFKIVKNRFLVNGKAVKFKGVNMHEHNEYTGHYNTRKDILTQLLLMKEFNINAIRTCHYPQPRAFYELCDSLGFYVYDEANIESHGMGYKLDRTLGNKKEWYAKHIDRIMNMYCRTASYPCVTILSLGNEAGNGVNFYNAYKELKRLEPAGQNRPVCYERAIREWNTDMFVPQYPSATWFRQMGENDKDKPVVPSEYSHAMGNSNGSLDLQWDAIYAYENLQGGFIWDWIDQGLAETDDKGRKYWTYGGDYGPEGTPSGQNFLCNGIVGPDLTPHPGAWEVKHVYQDFKVSSENPASGSFSLLNRFYFKDMSAYELRYELTADGEVVSQGNLPDVKPLAQQSQDFSVPVTMDDPAKTWCLNFFVSTGGNDVAYDQFILSEGAPMAVPEASSRIKLIDKKDVFLVKAPRLRFSIDKATGAVTRYRHKGKELIQKDFGMKPNFWRGPVDNDWGNNLPVRAAEWKDAGSAATVSAEATEESVRFTVAYALPDSASMTLSYEVLSNGAVKVCGEFKGGNKHLELPRLGLRTRLPASREDFTYFGRGPQENYIDRCSGALLGLYRSNATDEYFPYVRPQECGHHTDCRWLSIGGMTIVGDKTFEFNALRISTEQLDPRKEDGERFYGHVNDITPQNFTELCIDGGMTGVGGYDSWGARPEPSRTLWTDQDYSFSFAIIPDKILDNQE